MTEQERFYRDYLTIDSVVNGLRLLLIEFKARFLLYPKSKDITAMDKIAILTKAIEFLKAQEPRLVTYDDFHSGREDGGEAIPCWKEARSKTRRSGWAVIVYGKMLADLETGVARYWTARPTEEQMREEAWPGT